MTGANDDSGRQQHPGHPRSVALGTRHRLGVHPVNIITFVNQKGGVGKTTVVLGLAAAAAARSLDVVVVDLDPQANATTGLGVWDPPVTVDAALAEERSGTAASLVVDSAWGADVVARPPRLIPSSPALAAREAQLASDAFGSQDRLRLALEGLDADLVLIDCPPALGLLTVNGIFAADSVAVVTEPGAWSVDGVGQIVHNVRRISERRGGRPSLAGIVVNKVPRTRDGRYWHDQLREAHPGLILDASIRHRAALTEAAAQSLPIHALHRAGAAEAIAELDAVLGSLIRVGSGPGPDDMPAREGGATDGV